MKVEEALIHSYAMLIKRGRCTIKDIPENYRTKVRDYLAIGMYEEVKEEEPIPEERDRGAFTLPKIELSLQSGKAFNYDISNLFTDEILNGNEKPDVTKYEVVILEPKLPFDIPPSIEVYPIDIGFSIKITGKPSTQVAGTPSLLTVIRIKSRNYDDMNLSLYITIEE